ncbi:TPA: WYL domain-containing protein [Enterobacter asburiae]|nr:WYL domain-containing protein [Enterobacter asburiae]
MDFKSIINDDYDLAIRLAFIDFRLFFTGTLSRSDIIEEFAVSEITATRILNGYKKIRANNLLYSNKTKKFTVSNEFTPLIDISAEDALDMLSSGFDKNKILRGRNIVVFERIGLYMPPLDKIKVAKITRAIFNKTKIKCSYNSIRSGDVGERMLSPLVILFDGRNWIFRAYQEDSKNNLNYKNFNFSRVSDVTELTDSINHEFGLDYDDLWIKFLPVELEINPSLDESVKNEIRRDYNIQDGQDKILFTERAAFLWIIFNEWSVDFKQKNHDGFKFKLNNVDMLRSQGAIS